MGKATVAFRSKPISSRSGQLRPVQRRPPGTFRFFDLPPELRHHILEILVRDLKTAHKDILSLFLTCERLYSETASLFYHEVVLDTTRSRGKPDPFLSGPATRISPRRHVRTLSIYFYIKEHTHLFYTRYRSAIRDMAERGTLHRLELEIHSCFPSADFWGSGDEADIDFVTKRPGKEVSGPRFVAEPSFQSFLKFLHDAKVPQLRLYVDAADHQLFWCQFHRTPASGRVCDGEWKGKTKMLKINWKQLIHDFRGVWPADYVAQQVEE